MTVRFKCQSEYQKSYRLPRSRSASPRRCAPLAGLRSDHMGLSREPDLQRRRKPGPGARPLLCAPEPHGDVTSAASRSRSAHRAEPSPGPRPPTPPEPPAEPESDPAQPGPAESPRPAAANPGPPAGPGPAAADPGLVSSAKPRPSHPDSQPQPGPVTAAPDGQQPSANEVDQALRWRAGLRSGGQRSGGHRSEHRRQFRWKKPATSASPLLTAEQVLYSSSRSIPPFKKNPVAMETEYQRSFRALAPPTGPRLLKHLEHQRIPLFHTHTTNKKRREESPKMPHPKEHVPAPKEDDITPPPPPPQVQRRHRKLTEYESSFRSPLHRIPEEGGATAGDAPQVSELRRRASSYRRRAWGTHFSRDHLSQLRSEHNALWEATDTATDSAPGSASPRLTLDLCQEPDSGGTSCPEALDLLSRSSETDTHTTNNNTPTRRQAWEEEEEETDEEEGRLPTPRLKMKPVQRTHHDLTTPASGGAILVGKVTSGDERCGSAVSMAAGADPAVHTPMRQMEAWSENNPPHRPSPGPSPSPKQACKPIRAKQTPSPPVAAPHQAPPPPHCIQGTLRHPDFQHNGELGSRFRELQCSGDDEDDRLSVMSWRSAASCSVASAVLERAQKRRENFWGKR